MVAATDESLPASTLIERTGIEIIPESQRTAKPRDLFWPWFAANVSVFGMSYGSFVLGFGISFWQATLVSVIGIVVSFLALLELVKQGAVEALQHESFADIRITNTSAGVPRY